MESHGRLFQTKQDSNFIEFQIPSNPLYLGHFAIACTEFLKHHGASDHLEGTVVARELLANAIHHGNRDISELTVFVRIERREGQFKIVVEDQGNGFDYENINMSLPEDPRRVSSRGYSLIHDLSSRLEFNEKGNRVTAYISAT